MSLVERLAAGPPPVRRERCTVGLFLDALDDELRAAFEAALDIDSPWSHAALVPVIKEAGGDIKQHTISRHRRGGCRCESR